MAISIDYSTYEILIPKADMALVQSVPTEIRQLNLDTFRKALKDLEDNDEGMAFPDTHLHNTTVEVGGVILARVVQILDPYTVTFEDGQYAVNLVGANTNLGDKVNVNQVSVRSANSAGLQDLSTLLASAYNGEVFVDTVNGQFGTDIPIGTRGSPCKLTSDAVQIAQKLSINTLHYVGTVTLDTGDQVEGYTLVGDNHQRTTIIVNPGADTLNCEILDATVLGTLDGNSALENCNLSTLAYVSGEILGCLLESGTITLGGGANAYIIDSKSGVAGTSTPEIDCGGSGQSLVIRNYSGGIKLSNKTGSDAVSIDVNSGQVILAPTVTNGTIVVRGDCKLVDESGNHILTGTWNGGVTILNETTSILHPHTLDSIEQSIWNSSAALTVKKFIGLK